MTAAAATRQQTQKEKRKRGSRDTLQLVTAHQWKDTVIAFLRGTNKHQLKGREKRTANTRTS